MYSSGPGSKRAAAWFDSVYNLIDLFGFVHHLGNRSVALGYFYPIFPKACVFFPHWVKCTHCIMQNNSTEGPGVVNPILQTP